MIKGCQREMIIMQTQDSPLFESAYFILRRQKLPPSKQDMVSEANRIIGVGSGYLACKRRKRGRMWLFLCGLFCGGLLAVGVMILFMLLTR